MLAWLNRLRHGREHIRLDHRRLRDLPDDVTARTGVRGISRHRWIQLGLGPLLVCWACGSGPAKSGDGQSRAIDVITSGGFAAAYNVLGPKFERDTGVRLISAYGASTGGAPDSIPMRLARGEPADLIILSKPALDALTSQGEVVGSSRVDLAASKIGMAVKRGSPKPDISSPEAFIATLLAARSIGYSASVSGTYLSTDLFPRLGIWEELEPRSVRVASERVGSVVARGEVEIGFQQISEILPIEGADLVGPIPGAFQKVSTFSAGLTTRARNPADARALLDFLSSADVAQAIAATGLEPTVSREESDAPQAAPQ